MGFSFSLSHSPFPITQFPVLNILDGRYKIRTCDLYDVNVAL